MASGVRQIKNPKSIIVKSNYKNIIQMIGPETSSTSRMLKSYPHTIKLRVSSRICVVWRYYPIGLQHPSVWACFLSNNFYYIFIIWFNHDAFWIFNVAYFFHRFGTFPAKLKWRNLNSNPAQVMILIPLGKYQNGEWGSPNQKSKNYHG